MSTITIKDLPTPVHRALRARAERHGRSLNREIIATLEGSLRSAPVDAAPTAAHARAVRESLGVYLTQKDLIAQRDAGRR
jgi:plasmid stability protein